jgi:hypothetical protein
MGEIIHFTVHSADDSNAKRRAKKLAAELNFSSWMLKMLREEFVDGTSSTTWRLEGWQSEGRRSCKK